MNGDAPDPAAEAQRLGALLVGRTVDVCFAGIGENGHLAFNDPPTDFTTGEPFLVVPLDDRLLPPSVPTGACRGSLRDSTPTKT